MTSAYSRPISYLNNFILYFTFDSDTLFRVGCIGGRVARFSACPVPPVLFWSIKYVVQSVYFVLEVMILKWKIVSFHEKVKTRMSIILSKATHYADASIGQWAEIIVEYRHLCLGSSGKFVIELSRRLFTIFTRERSNNYFRTQVELKLYAASAEQILLDKLCICWILSNRKYSARRVLQQDSGFGIPSLY